MRKLHLCAFTFDFTNPTAHVREKEMKRQTLLELVDYVNSGTGKFTEQVRLVGRRSREHCWQMLPGALEKRGSQHKTCGWAV